MPYPTPDEIDAAAARIAPHVRATPILTLEPEAFGLPCPVTLKLEHTQVTGSFKVRGAFNNMLSREVPKAGVVAASGGNHGAAVAHAATELGHASKIYVPRAIAKEEKLRRMRAFGGEVILTEGSVAECMAEYAAAAEATGALSVHPYDTPWTLAGQGTVAREIEAQMGGPGSLDTILVATGGGGLIGGIAARFGDRVNVVSVETEGTDTLARSLREGPEIDVGAAGVAAGSLGGPRLGVDAWAVISERVRTALVLSDAEVFRAGQVLWEATRLVGEPGAAVALAALTSGAYVPERDERLAVLICGGNADVDWFVA
ncbi:MAG: serine/threonine dehydratase [Roseicyclus sp.]